MGLKDKGRKGRQGRQGRKDLRDGPKDKLQRASFVLRPVPLRLFRPLCLSCLLSLGRSLLICPLVSPAALCGKKMRTRLYSEP